MDIIDRALSAGATAEDMTAAQVLLGNKFMSGEGFTTREAKCMALIAKSRISPEKTAAEIRAEEESALDAFKGQHLSDMDKVEAAVRTIAGFRNVIETAGYRLVLDPEVDVVLPKMGRSPTSTREKTGYTYKDITTAVAMSRGKEYLGYTWRLPGSIIKLLPAAATFNAQKDSRWLKPSGQPNKNFQHTSAWENAKRVIDSLGAENSLLTPYRS